LRWAEEAEHALYRAAGHGLGAESFPRKAVTVSYHRPLRAGDPYRVDLAVERVGSSSISYRWHVVSGEQVCAEGRHTVVQWTSRGGPPRSRSRCGPNFSRGQEPYPGQVH
jgi:acyl-CoA thioester hydrolase